MGRLVVHGVDDEGITVGAVAPRAVDVLFDGRRVWSFWVPRDTEAAGRRRQRARWPDPLRRYLDGSTRLALRDPATGAVDHEDDVSFGTGRDRVQVVNQDGIALGFDKSGMLVPTFETRDAEDIAGLVHATTVVLDELRAAGARPFVAYGTLLGTVREGAMLGHDSDADVAYVSDHAFPVDVIRESFGLQRDLGRRGLETVRYSGSAFKVVVRETDGHERGLDVFAGFLDQGRLWLMGEVGVPFEREWLYPLGTARLEGVEVPVPARPEKLLEAMYGPGWRVPDPVFKFTTPASTRRTLSDWFRGLRPRYRYWHHRHSLRRHRVPDRDPKRIARLAAREARATGASVLDVGAGKGADALWLARRKIPTVAYDYATIGLDVVVEQARQEGAPLTARALNLNDTRQVLGEAARLAHTEGRRIVVAHHLLDALGDHGRENLWRFCSMVLRGGGRLYAEFFPDATPETLEWSSGRVNVAGVVAALEHQGACDVEVDWLPETDDGPRAVRLVAQWTP